jgi:hypothetical protein
MQATIRKFVTIAFLRGFPTIRDARNMPDIMLRAYSKAALVLAHRNNRSRVAIPP